mgnify:CR=1 FL=1
MRTFRLLTVVILLAALCGFKRSASPEEKVRLSRVAPVTLMPDDLSRLPLLIQHSHRTLRSIRQNIGFSLAVKAHFVVLNFAGYSSLWAAIAADMGASLLVIANGLRLLRI